MKRLKRLCNSFQHLDMAFKNPKVNGIFINELKEVTKNVLDIESDDIDLIYDKIVDKISNTDSKTYEAIQDYMSDNKIEEDELPNENNIINFLNERVVENIDINY